jgi:hypothetical protein
MKRAFFFSVHCVRGMYCFIFRVTVLAQADVESDAVEENMSSYVGMFWV